MQILRLLPAILGPLLLAAHLSRLGAPLGWVVAVALLPLVLIGGSRFAVRVVQLVLIVGGVEWLRTAVRLIGERRAAGQPFLRLLLILGAVIVLDAVAVPLVEVWRRRRAARRPEVTTVTA